MALIHLLCSCALHVQDLVSTGKQNLLYFPLRSGFSFLFPQTSSVSSEPLLVLGFFPVPEVEAAQLCLLCKSP